MAESTGVRGVICRVGDRRFSLALADVREVCTEVPIVRMPGVAAAVEGVAKVRGSLVTVVRVADLLGVETGHAGPSPWLVVLQYRDGRVALGVDEVEDLEVGAGSVPRFEVGSQLAAHFEAG
jgi:chemotaxis signal transduction protein